MTKSLRTGEDKTMKRKILNIINENKSGKGGKDDKGGMEK